MSATTRLDGMLLVEHTFDVPLDHGTPGSPTIRLFAREVVPASAPRESRPMLLYLQGGPGGTSPRPRARDGWIAAALDDGFRVLLLDQRGTGRSALVDLATLPSEAPAAAERLRHFRADAIVRDAEVVRRSLLGDDGRWTLLGQSYGGFLALTYLSLAPEALDGVMITGGVPSLDRPALDVYRATFEEVARKTTRHLERYPQDERTLLDLLAYVRDHEVTLPDGTRLSEAQLRTLGFQLGMADGREALHEALELAFVGEGAERRLPHAFLSRLQGLNPFAGNPIFSVLHEAAYAQGEASAWAAERALAERAAAGAIREPWLTGEMLFRLTFADGASLRPLAAAAELLAARADWPRLYDVEALARNRVPVASIAYAEDMYVPLAFSQETAARVGRMRAWVTNEYEHDGLRKDGARILRRLLAILRE
jgi:pimeloyl-ACP methyl ester carboxylesterase